MTQPARPLAFVACVSAGAALLLTACTVNVNTEGATATETRKFTVKGAPTVTLDTFDGSIEVHSWDRPEVEVIVEKQAPDEAGLKEIVIDETQNGDTISLTVRGPAHRGTSGVVIGVVYSPGAKLRVALPRATTLTLRSGDGSINVEELSGRLSLRTDDGSIVAARVTGDVVARTDDGSVRLRDIHGTADVESLDGSVGVAGVLTQLRAKTDDGSVRVTAEAGSTVADDWHIETGDGTVEVHLPTGVNAEIDAETSDGAIRSSYPGLHVPERGEGDDDSRRSVKATLGAGGHTVRVRTRDGSIRFAS